MGRLPRRRNGDRLVTGLLLHTDEAAQDWFDGRFFRSIGRSEHEINGALPIDG